MSNLPKGFIENLSQLISIPSIYEESENYPFGKNIDRCLDRALEISDSLGFKTFKDPNGYYGYAQIGKGAELIGVLGHLDVVPVGDINKWTSNPFTLTKREDRLYGRGTQDDKGPMLIAMYALKNLVDQGITLNKRIRFIFGTDEETLWRGIAKYNETEEIPKFGFTPDSCFPLTYAEKGLLQFNIIGSNPSGVLIKGGDAYNAVPSQIAYNGKDVSKVKAALDKRGFEYVEADNGALTITGKSVHAKDAHLGINPISRLCIALNDIGCTSDLVKFVSEVVGEDAHATNIFGNIEDQDTGKIAFNIGKIDINKDQEILNVDMRIPISTTKEEIEEKLVAATSKYNLQYEQFDWLNSVYIPKESKLIQDLVNSYQTVTGDTTSKPMASGGATYARAIDNCVAFGALFPSSDKTEHQVNENIAISDIEQAIKVYELTFKTLLSSNYDL